MKRSASLVAASHAPDRSPTSEQFESGSQATSGSLSARPVFGIFLSSRTGDQILDDILAPPESGAGPQMLATINTDHVVNLRRNSQFREAYGFASQVTVDGAPVLAYARLAGARVRERITGADLFDRLLRRWQPELHRLFFVVASDEAASATDAILTKRGFASEDLRFAVPPFGFHTSSERGLELAGAIRDFAPTHLIMALGSPKSEIWIHQYAEQLGDCHVLCVGAAVEFSAGLKKRAPKWVRKVGLEWLFRFASEPRRLFRRYFVDSFGLLAAIAADIRSRGTSVL